MTDRTDEMNSVCLGAFFDRDGVFTKLAKIPGIQLIYASSLACTRHRGSELVALQRQGVLSYLLFDEIDMISGDYITKAKAAAAEIARERDPSGIILMTGCQSALLSTDYGLLTKEIEEEINIPVKLHDGCRLCGFDDENSEAGAGKLNRLLYDFIRPCEKSAQPSVNIIGSVDLVGSELFSALDAAGVKNIFSLSTCKSREDYQEMGSAHLNIITSAQDIPVGAYLQEKLNIPWVCLGGIYDPEELENSYKKLGEIFGCEIDVSGMKSRLAEKLLSAKSKLGSCKITIENDAYLAKWLLSSGFSVESLVLSPHHSVAPELKKWFEKNAHNFVIKSFERGRRSLERRGGAGGGRPEHGSGRGQFRSREDFSGGPDRRGAGHTDQKSRGSRGFEKFPAGFAGSIAALEFLEESTGGAVR